VRELEGMAGIRPRMIPCRIEKLEQPAPDVAVMGLRLPMNENFRFLAGQYIDILLKDQKRRSYSIALQPKPEGVTYLELHVRHSAGGLFTDHLFSKAKVRDILRFEGPLGTFYLREDEGKPLIFVAGGTGFAPIKAIVEHIFEIGLDNPIVLYWGARSRKDLYMPELPARWRPEHRDFTYIPVLSDPLPADAWEGRTGLVHQAVLDDFADLSGYQVYACGAPAMTDIARATFVAERRLPEDEFYCDAFTPSVDPKR